MEQEPCVLPLGQQIHQICCKLVEWVNFNNSVIFFSKKPAVDTYLKKLL